MFSVVDQPTKLQLAGFLNEAIRAKLATQLASQPKKWRDSVTALAERIVQNPPSKQYQLILLRHIAPHHEIFAKNYVKPKP